MSTRHAKMAERSTGMAEKSIGMAEKSIETIQNIVNGRSDSPLQLNRAQCKYLAQELAYLRICLQGRYDMFKAGQDVRQIAWLHLHTVIKKAELLVEKCCCKNVKSWLSLVEIQEHFAAIIVDLHQWRMAMDVAIGVVMGASCDQMENLLQLMDGEYQEAYKRLRSRDHALQQATVDDRKEIVSKLAEVQESEDSLEYLCALHLQSWLAEVDDQTHSTNTNVIQKLIKHVSHENTFLGTGGCGSVHRVNWLGVKCALKRLNVKDEREARVLKGLHHPNIVRLYMYWDDQSEIQTPYEADGYGTDGHDGHEFEPLPKSNLLMELMHTDLSGHIKRRMERMASSSREGEDMMPFSLPVAIDIMLQVGQALRFMHDKHLTHRDLKTANILVRRVNKALTHFYNEGYLEIKLADFGLAKAYEHTSTSQWQGRNAGTKKYGAPEVFDKDWSDEKKRKFPPMADVWSFGMTCSEILSGKVPYDKEYVPTLHARIVKGNLRPTLPKLCPEYLAFIIRGCWELQPERRPNFASICTMLSHAKLLSLGITKLDDSERFLRYTPRRGSEQILQISRLQVAETSTYRKFLSYFQAPSEIMRRRSTGEVQTFAWKDNRMQSEVAGAKQQPRNHSTHTLRTSKRFLHFGGIHSSLRGAGFEEFDTKPTIFSYKELHAATRGFHEDMKLGQGGYGAVYKGLLPSGQVVAIKQLFTTKDADWNEFVNEMVLVITGMKHRNLVNLIGCCEHQRLLVYEFVDNYDVHQVLFGSKKEEMRSRKKEEMRSRLACWSPRHKICLGIAHGLHYLHAMVHPRVIYRSIKATNVLLTSDLEAKIADFGLAHMPPDKDSYMTEVVGTMGYFSPEYASLGLLSNKVDIYNFGALCLEIVSGRHIIDSSAPPDQLYLLDWVRRLHEQDKLIDLVDPILEVRDEEVKDVQRFLIMCVQCISQAVEKRPSMAQIVSILQGDTESEMLVLEEERLSSELGSLCEDGSSTLSFIGSS